MESPPKLPSRIDLIILNVIVEEIKINDIEKVKIDNLFFLINNIKDRAESTVIINIISEYRSKTELRTTLL